MNQALPRVVFRRSRVWVSLKQVRLSVSAHTKFAYSFGQLAEGIKTSSFSLFLLFYYNQVLGVSGTLCAIALFIAMCFDAITDPLVGSSLPTPPRIPRAHDA